MNSYVLVAAMTGGGVFSTFHSGYVFLLSVAWFLCDISFHDFYAMDEEPQGPW